VSAGRACSPWQWPALPTAPAAGRGFTPLALPTQPRGPAPEPDEPEPAVSHADRREARRAIDEARTRAAQAHEAVARVRAELETAGRETLDAQVAAFEVGCEDLLGALRVATQERLDRLERELAGLVAEMAAKVVHRQIAADDGIVLDVVRGTLQRAAGAERITVHVAASDQPAVRAAQAELLAAAAGADELEIVADCTVEAGGCMVATTSGQFDARIATQLAALDAEVARILGEG